MAAIWPFSLPQKFLQDSYRESGNPDIITADYDVGEPQTRPRSQYEGRIISGSFRMTATQLQTFKTFFNVAIISGTQEFEFPDPLDELNTLLVKFDPEQSPPYSIGSFGGRYLTLSVYFIVQP